MKITQAILGLTLTMTAATTMAQINSESTLLKKEVLAQLNRKENGELKASITDLICYDNYQNRCDENSDSVLEKDLMKSSIIELAQDTADNCPKQDCDPAVTMTTVSQMTAAYSDGTKWADYTNMFSFIIRKNTNSTKVTYRGWICKGDRFTENGKCELKEIELK